MQLILDKQRSLAGRGARKDPIDAHVGRRMRLARTAMGWSQATLAGQLRVSPRQIQKYESGTNRIGAGRLYRLARLFDVSVQYFFDGMPKFDGSSGGDGNQDLLTRMRISGATNQNDRSDRRLLHLVTAYDEIRDPVVQEALGDLVTEMCRSLALERARARARRPD